MERGFLVTLALAYVVFVPAWASTYCTDDTLQCQSKTEKKCIIAAVFTAPSTICKTSNNETCVGVAPTCAEVKNADPRVECSRDGLGRWLEPEEHSAFPLSLAKSESNDLWTPWCKRQDGTLMSMEPIVASSPEDIWEMARAAAGCEDHPAALPRSGFLPPTRICVARSGKRCIGVAPTCTEVRALDDQLAADNGGLCDDGFWVEPEDDSMFPISIAASVAQSNSDEPETNTIWHPFCMTTDGPERIGTIESHDPSTLWRLAAKEAGCPDHPATLPQTNFELPHRKCYSQSGKLCIGGAPTCAELRAVDATWTKDNGELCDSGYFLTPEEGSSFPISISASILHSIPPHSDGPGDSPETLNHWHPFCMTVDGPERIKTVKSFDPNEIWALAREKAGCVRHPAPLPRTGFVVPDMQSWVSMVATSALTVSGKLCAEDETEKARIRDGELFSGGLMKPNVGLLARRFEPEGDNMLPVAIATSQWHKVDGSTRESYTEGGVVERIHTSYGQGKDTCDVWNSVQQMACCTGLPVPKMGLDGIMNKENCFARDTSKCYSQTGKVCLRAPTCDEVRKQDDRWGVDNGNMCDLGYWLEPEENSVFPISIAAGRDHGHDPTVDGNRPDTLSHWHPFCYTSDGAERIKTVHGLNPETLWDGARANGGCKDIAADLPQTSYSMPRTDEAKPGGTVVVDDGQDNYSTIIIVAATVVCLATGLLYVSSLEASKVKNLHGYQITPELIKLVSLIGRGAAGEVWKAECFNEVVAVKYISGGKHSTDYQIAKFCAEALLMADLQSYNGGVAHPNLVQMRRCCFGDSDHLFLVLDFYELGSMKDVMENIRLQKANGTVQAGIMDHLHWKSDSNGLFYNLINGIAHGLDYLHSVDIIHRDVKPANVLIEGNCSDASQWNARISDFGESKIHVNDGGEAATMTQVGTPMYIAPEVLAEHAKYDAKADTFSFGLLLLDTMTVLDHGGLIGCWGGGFMGPVATWMVMGRRPMIPEEVQQEQPMHCTLVERCWNAKPEERPKLSEVIAQFETACREPNDPTVLLEALAIEHA